MFQAEFQKWLKEEGRSPKTIQAYVQVVNDLSKWYEKQNGEKFDPQETSAYDLQRFIQKMMETQEQATINKKVASLKTYWKFLIETDRVKTDPTRKLKMKSLASSQMAPKWLTPRERSKFLDFLESPTIEKNEWKRLRNIAMGQLMLQAGLRVSEVASLDLDNLIALDKPRERKVLIRYSKHGRSREIPLNLDVTKALQAWLKVRGESKESDPAVFLSERKTRISERAIQTAISKVFKAANLPYTCHSLRHTAAKLWVNHKGIEVAQRLLGHENIQTTQRYVTPSEHDLRQAVDSTSSERD
ncbi:tyrosine-type recombinase/integrase [Thermoactinomyces sp. CICC 10522]|uniref:tyrosine-type recombinase/integrase n=1 Tax=Thermoactinomyces sp. CICC 10522 TaxID=2767427 RepID=UPI0018DC5CE2|nr:tyrosine-type recombinase/integrase [Thermoactinomyces sp. CICC 10522]MBH8605584.1 tyrosine-type recombinase/integrase [Thermoactinomyces sp. CICC 10522]